MMTHEVRMIHATSPQLEIALIPTENMMRAIAVEKLYLMVLLHTQWSTGQQS